MTKPKKYKTGDVVTKRKQSHWDFFVEFDGGIGGWAVVSQDHQIAYTYATRSDARWGKLFCGERIARVIKETPKTVTVVISK